MPEESAKDPSPPARGNSRLASDHLANERTFLAWLRTGVAIVVFGFAVGRFSIAIRQWMEMQGRAVPQTTGISVWLGAIAIVAGILVCLAGLFRYRQTREQLESGNFEPPGFLIDLVGVLTALFGVGLGVYLIYIELHF